MEELVSIIILSTLAGLATGVGGLIVLIKKPGKKLFGFLGGFAVGVMIILSFFGLILETWEDTNFLITSVSFTIGALLMFLLDFLIPHIHFSIKEEGLLKKPKLFKTGVLIAAGIALHNFPEGISIGAGYLHFSSFGLFIAVSIALHNIPEGIAIALPIYKSGVSKLRSFKIALFSGLAEPLGAIVAALFLQSFRFLVPATLAFAAGVMVFITLDELIPVFHEHGHEHSTALGIIIGIIFMFLVIGIFNP